MISRNLSCLLVIVFTAVSASAETKITNTCDDTDGWIVLPSPAGASANAKITASDGAVHISYDRGDIAPVGHTIAIKGLKQLKLVVTSDQDALVGIVVEDSDMARFNHTFQLTAGQKTTVTIQPRDFKLNDDSPVQKTAVEPAKLGQAYALLDVGSIIGASGPNKLHIDEVTVVVD